MTDHDIAEFTESITQELHANIKAKVIRTGLPSGYTAIHRYPEGICIVNRPQTTFPYLWVMYVDPKERGMGAGSHMMQDIIARYGVDGGSISLQCHKSLQPFYNHFGFHVVEQYDDHVEMLCEFEKAED
jgi:GNAT superfamily N-acetyltransferase